MTVITERSLLGCLAQCTMAFPGRPAVRRPPRAVVGGRLLVGMVRSEPGGGQGRREWGRPRPWRLGAAGDRAAPLRGLPRVTGWRRCGRAGGEIGRASCRE